MSSLLGQLHDRDWSRNGVEQRYSYVGERCTEWDSPCPYRDRFFTCAVADSCRPSLKDIASVVAFSQQQGINGDTRHDSAHAPDVHSYLSGTARSAPMVDLDQGITTMMLRNIPKSYTVDIFLRELNDAGFRTHYDFMYSPMDPKHPMRGFTNAFVFVNFYSPCYAAMFYHKFNGLIRLSHPDGNVKILEVLPAEIHGFDANYAHYKEQYAARRTSKKRRNLFPAWTFDEDGKPISLHPEEGAYARQQILVTNAWKMGHGRGARAQM